MKKLLALLLALAMVLSLAACADKDEGPAYDGTGPAPVVENPEWCQRKIKSFKYTKRH